MLAAALLGFALSIDDFVITYLNAGSTQTFPIFVWGIARVSVPPQVNVVASAIFLVAIALGLANVWWQYRSARQAQGEGAAGFPSKRRRATSRPRRFRHAHSRLRDLCSDDADVGTLARSAAGAQIGADSAIHPNGLCQREDEVLLTRGAGVAAGPRARGRYCGLRSRTPLPRLLGATSTTMREASIVLPKRGWIVVASPPPRDARRRRRRRGTLRRCRRQGACSTSTSSLTATTFSYVFVAPPAHATPSWSMRIGPDAVNT